MDRFALDDKPEKQDKFLVWTLKRWALALT